MWGCRLQLRYTHGARTEEAPPTQTSGILASRSFLVGAECEVQRAMRREKGGVECGEGWAGVDHAGHHQVFENFKRESHDRIRQQLGGWKVGQGAGGPEGERWPTKRDGSGNGEEGTDLRAAWVGGSTGLGD